MHLQREKAISQLQGGKSPTLRPVYTYRQRCSGSLICLMATLRGRLGVQPILPVRVPGIIDTILNFDGDGGDVMFKQSFRVSPTFP